MKIFSGRAGAKSVLAAASGAAGIIGLTACALQYAEPTGDQTAELQVSTNAPLAMLFYRDAAQCTDALQVRQPAVGQTSYRIPADKEFALRFFYIEGGMTAWVSCQENIVSFHPKPGGVYVLHYELNQGVCGWALNERGASQETPVPVSKRERNLNIASMGGEGAWCKAKSS